MKLLRFSSVATLVFVFALGARAEEPSPARTALGRLKVGNERFVKNALAPVSLSAVTRQSLAKGQAPFAMVLSCADSRVPPEFIFNVGLGDLFVVRTAGEVIDKSILATLEYGAEHLHIPLLVVMGHESCGAVKAVVDKADVAGPNLAYMVKAIRAGTTRSQAEQSDIKAAILANVEQAINDALAGSEILQHAVDAGKLQVVGADHPLASGQVTFSEPIGTGIQMAQAVPAAAHK